MKHGMMARFSQISKYPSKIERDLSNGPLSKLLGLLETQVFSGTVGPVGDFFETILNSGKLL